MLDIKSVKVRFLSSLFSNSVRAMLGFLTNLLIARSLSPSGYGNLMFLLNSFLAIIILLDLGSSNAFFTFISQRTHKLRIYTLYWGWLLLQFIVVLLLVVLIMPDALIHKIWLGHTRVIILLAFVASFLQQRVWQTVSQIGESRRKTVKVQLASLLMAIVYIVAIVILALFKLITVKKVLFILIAIYGLTSILTLFFVGEKKAAADIQEIGYKDLLNEFWHYCCPLMLLSAVNFGYQFLDTWFLQKFSGAAQQAFFQIGNQFSRISLLAATSILRVFWKEVAEAKHRNDVARVAELYRRVSRGLVIFSAIISGFLIPWAQQIVVILLGHAYRMAWVAVAILFLYPIHQALGQINGVMFYANQRTASYSKVSLFVMLVSIPISYFMLAPTTGVLIPGLHLGAVGVALKLVVINIVSVNVMSWMLARYYKWKFDWLYQLVGVGGALSLGYAVRAATIFLFPLTASDSLMHHILVIGGSGVPYLALYAAMIWFMPWLIGWEKNSFKRSQSVQ